MKKSLNADAAVICIFALVLASAVSSKAETLNIVPFGSMRLYSDQTGPLGETGDLSSFNRLYGSDGIDALGVFWWEARDIQRVVVVFSMPISGEVAAAVRLQYWQRSWPEAPPQMPAIEDQEDDLWQGRWITASTTVAVEGRMVTYSFRPMQVDENPAAGNLPEAVTYRRTLKLRLCFPFRPPVIEDMQIHSMSKIRKVSIRIVLNQSGRSTSFVKASLSLYNGHLEGLRGFHWQKTDRQLSNSSWSMNLNGRAKGAIALVTAVDELLPGSNEESIVTVHTDRSTFSFLVNDLRNGPISIPAYDVLIDQGTEKTAVHVPPKVGGNSIRQKISKEYEQDYGRARKDIPELDPTRRDPRHALQYVYLPLAADGSWQKFAVIWGGHILIDKKRTKAEGREYERCQWRGDELRWEIGTGLQPVYARGKDDCQVSFLNDYLPLVITRWQQKGLIYEQEAFATLLHGPLSPSDPRRDEQTPALLMMKLRLVNPSSRMDTAHVWLAGNQALSRISIDHGFIMDSVDPQPVIRAFYQSPAVAAGEVIETTDGSSVRSCFHQTIPLGANDSQTIYFCFPFVGDLPAQFQNDIRQLNYEREKDRVVSYWRDLVQPLCAFDVPESEFDQIGKSVMPHLRMSVTKDPRSGLYLVPAGTLGYGVYANEACFQIMLLDRLGDHRTAALYLEPFLQLQGSVPLAGDFSGDQKDVFYGVRVDSLYDLTAAPYNLDHGTVLWTLALHYLYTRDDGWLQHAAPHMKRAADWIIGQRHRTQTRDQRGDRDIHYGLLPAGRLEDAAEWQYWYAVNAYAYLGLSSTAAAFRQARLPEAEYYQEQASGYLADIRASVGRAMELAPVVRCRNQQYMPYVPSQAHQRQRAFGPKARYYDRYQRQVNPTLRQSATREVLYGPLVLVKAGIIDPADSAAEWILDDWEDNLTLSSSMNLNVHGWVDDDYWFSRGGMVFQANLQNPVQVYLKRHEIPAALRSLYNAFTACLYPDVNILAEEFRTWSHASGHYYKTPDEARFVDQLLDLLVLENRDELWLASGTPRRWLEPGQRIELIGATSQYGRVAFVLHSGQKAGKIEATVDLQLHSRPRTVSLFIRAPFSEPIASVQINGQPWKDWDNGNEVITLPVESGHYNVIVSYQNQSEPAGE